MTKLGGNLVSGFKKASGENVTNCSCNCDCQKIGSRGPYLHCDFCGEGYFSDEKFKHSHIKERFDKIILDLPEEKIDEIFEKIKNEDPWKFE